MNLPLPLMFKPRNHTFFFFFSGNYRSGSRNGDSLDHSRMNQPITTVVALVHYIDKMLAIILRGFVEGTGSHRHYSSPDCISKLWQEWTCRKPFPMTVALKTAFRGGRCNASCHINTKKETLSHFSTHTRFLGSALLPLGQNKLLPALQVNVPGQGFRRGCWASSFSPTVQPFHIAQTTDTGAESFVCCEAKTQAFCLKPATMRCRCTAQPYPISGTSKSVV